MTEKGKQAGMGAGMFGGAGVSGLLALGALTAAIIAALATGDGGVARGADRRRRLCARSRGCSRCTGRQKMRAGDAAGTDRQSRV